MSKLLLLTLNEQEEKAIEKSYRHWLTAYLLKPYKLFQFRLWECPFRDWKYGRANTGIVLSQEQIFEAVWNMDSDSCHSSVAGGISLPAPQNAPEMPLKRLIRSP